MFWNLLNDISSKLYFNVVKINFEYNMIKRKTVYSLKMISLYNECHYIREV